MVDSGNEVSSVVTKRVGDAGATEKIREAKIKKNATTMAGFFIFFAIVTLLLWGLSIFLAMKLVYLTCWLVLTLWIVFSSKRSVIDKSPYDLCLDSIKTKGKSETPEIDAEIDSTLGIYLFYSILCIINFLTLISVFSFARKEEYQFGYFNYFGFLTMIILLVFLVNNLKKLFKIKKMAHHKNKRAIIKSIFSSVIFLLIDAYVICIYLIMFGILK